MTLMITAMTRNEEENLQRELEKEYLKKERRALELTQENRKKQKEQMLRELADQRIKMEEEQRIKREEFESSLTARAEQCRATRAGK